MARGKDTYQRDSYPLPIKVSMPGPRLFILLMALLASLPLTYALSSCSVISSNGSYSLTANITGAPNNATPLLDRACIKIASNDVIFDCDGYSITDNGTAGTTYGILLNGSLTNVTIKDCDVSNYTYGIYVYQSNFSVIVNNSAHNNSETGFVLESGADFNNLTGNRAFNNSQFGFLLHVDSDYNILERNLAYYDLSRGFYLYSGASHNNLTNNLAYSNRNRGFYLDTQCSFNILINNTASDNSGNRSYGFHIYANSSFNTLINNTAKNNELDGFRIQSSLGNNLTNDTAYNNSIHGFLVDINSSYNVFTGCQASINTQNGFDFESSDNNSILSGAVSENGLNGIFINQSYNSTVSSNYVSHNPLDGITAYNSDSTTIVNNTVDGCGIDNIAVHASDDANISNNRLYNAGSSGIFSNISAAGAHIIGNYIENTSYDGIDASVNSGALIDGNNITNTTQISIRCDYGRDLLIERNLIIGAPSNSVGIGSNNLSDSTIRNNSISGKGSGFYFVSSEVQNNTFINNSVFNNTNGFNFDFRTHDNHLDRNTIFNNSQYGIRIYNSSVYVFGDHIYNNVKDIEIWGGYPTETINLTNVIFDNPSGNMQNLTVLSLNDTVYSGERYSISWSSQPPNSLPYGFIHVNGTFLDIQQISGTVSIDKTIWSWNDSYIGGHNKNRFEIWKDDSSNHWSNQNASLDTIHNTLTLLNLTPASTYGLLEALDCRDEDGDGAPYSYTPGACVNVTELLGIPCKVP